MDITVFPGKLIGTIQPAPSKSLLHRYLICSALADHPTRILCGNSCDDVDATIDCLCALGAIIEKTDYGYRVTPIRHVPIAATLNCRESATTLRLLLPVVGALGVEATFHMSDTLSVRPLGPLWDEMERMGCSLARQSSNSIRCCGQLQCGEYSIEGSVSSQFISGLLIALALLPGSSRLLVTGRVESKPYINMTQQILRQFEAHWEADKISCSYPLHSPCEIKAEPDWSNAAFFLAANTLGSQIDVMNMARNSLQGDRVITDYLLRFNDHCSIDVSDTPDLLPILSVVAAAKKGATFCGIRRLRFKESDRVATVCSMLRQFGVQAIAAENTLTVAAGKFHGCTIDAHGDHRIAMTAAIAATTADGPVTILDAQCVSKSYPGFWDEFRRLGGSYAQHIR